MRWSIVFAYLSAVALVILLLSRFMGWTGWLLLVVIVLVAPAVIGIGISSRHSLSWASVLSYLSAVALLAALASQLLGLNAGRSWFLMAWTVLLLAPVITLFGHPMRRPAWGLFVGFWGVVAVVWLIVLQALAVADVLGGSAYSGWAAWPLAVIGIWLLVASGSGFGAERFPARVDVLGLVTGVGFLAISIATWAGSPAMMRVAGVVAAIAYCLWAAALGWIAWSIERAPQPVHRITTQRMTQAGS